MIKSFRHRGVERFFRSGSQAGIQPKHAKRLRLQLGQLDAASGPGGYESAGLAQTFSFGGQHAELIDYQDYH